MTTPIIHLESVSCMPPCLLTQQNGHLTASDATGQLASWLDMYVVYDAGTLPFLFIGSGTNGPNFVIANFTFLVHWPPEYAPDASPTMPLQGCLMFRARPI